MIGFQRKYFNNHECAVFGELNVTDHVIVASEFMQCASEVVVKPGYIRQQGVVFG